MKVVHVITGLGVGGAETMLAKLAGALPDQGVASTVVSLTSAGPVAARLEASGVRVRALGLGRAWHGPVALPRLTRWLREERPAVVQTWMYHADLLGGLAARRGGVPGVAWSLRQSNLAPGHNKATTLLTLRTCARLSRRIPDRIVCNSQAAWQAHAARGYDEARMVLIPNGFDLDRFAPSEEARRSVRAELGLGPDAPLVGLAARFDSQKDHRSFVAAAAMVAASVPGTHFLLCGRGVTPQNPDLTAWIRATGRPESFHLLGERADMPRLLASLDVAAGSSVGEGFSNALGEAMACAVPCAVTAAGDAADVVGPTGRVVPPGDHAGLAAAMHELLDLPAEKRRELGRMARARVAERYALPAIAARYAALYRELV